MLRVMTQGQNWLPVGFSELGRGRRALEEMEKWL